MLMKKWDRLPPEMRNDAVRSYYDILKKKRLTLICKRLFDIVASLVFLYHVREFRRTGNEHR